MAAIVSLIVVIFATGLAIQNGNADEMICQQVQGELRLTGSGHNQGYRVQGVRGKVGQKGSKGEKGENAESGSINLGVVEAIVKSIVKQELDQIKNENQQHREERVRMSNELRQLNGKLGRMNKMNEQLQDRLNATEKIVEELGFKLKSIEWERLCNFTYQEKCFFGIFPNRTSRTVNYHEAEELCALQNGEAADIYSEDQYNMLVAYMRSEIPSDMKWTEAWLGMKANPSDGTYTLSNGGPVPYFNWHLLYPRSDSSYTRFGIEIKKDPTSAAQGMFNYRPSGNIRGVICELQMI